MKIASIGLRVRNNRNFICRDCWVVSGATGNAFLTVRWEKKSRINNVMTVISTSDWTPMAIAVVLSNGKVVTKPNQSGSPLPWAKVLRYVRAMAYTQTSGGSSAVSPKHETSQQGAPIPEAPPKHPVLLEIDRRYHDTANAVVITPDSWLDKALASVYLSRRQNSQEDEVNE